MALLSRNTPSNASVNFENKAGYENLQNRKFGVGETILGAQ